MLLQVLFLVITPSMPLSQVVPSVEQQSALPFPNRWPFTLFWRCCGQYDEPLPPAPRPHGDASSTEGSGLWVTQILEKLWPYASGALDELVKTEAPGLINDYKPKWVGGIEISRFNPGKQAPVVRSVQVDQIDDDGIGEIRLLADVEFLSDSLDCQLTIKPLPPQLSRFLPKFLKGLVTYISSMTVGLRDLSISAKVFFMAKPLQSTLPLAGSIQVSLITPPEVDFRLTLTKGEANILNLLKPWLRRIIALSLDFITLPEHVSIPLEPGFPDIQKPEGVLLVWITGADEMPVMDLFGHCDTYVEVWVRSQIRRRTPVIYNEAHPRWGKDQANFQLLVHTRQCQALTFELWDADVIGGDDFVGNCSLPLINLEPMKPTNLSLPILSDFNEEGTYRSASYAGATSARGCSAAELTRLHVHVQYIPATMADKSMHSIGVLNMKLEKVHVPSLSVLPLYLKPYVTNQPFQTSCKPKALRPMIGKDAGRLDIAMFPLPFNCAWDILGDHQQVASSTFNLELVTSPSAGASVVARVEVPLATIMHRPFAGLSGTAGTAGGAFSLRAQSSLSKGISSGMEFVFEMQLLWNPLVHDKQGVSLESEPVPEGGAWISFNEVQPQ